MATILDQTLSPDAATIPRRIWSGGQPRVGVMDGGSSASSAPEGEPVGLEFLPSFFLNAWSNNR
jgi:hypothetical protein